MGANISGGGGGGLIFECILEPITGGSLLYVK